MSVPVLAAFFKRFAVRFIEVIGAGVATAVTGYLLAHFGGYWSSYLPSAYQPAPAVVQAAPSVSVVPKSARAEPTAATADQRLAPAATDVSTRTAKANPAAPFARKRAASDPASPEAKAREPERDMQAVEAQVRAALANVDANRVAPSDAPAHPAEIPSATPVAPTQPDAAAPTQPAAAAAPTAEEPAATAVAPRADDNAPQPALKEELKEAEPKEAGPLPAVEIKSLPVASVDAAPSPSAPALRQNGDEPAHERVPEDRSLIAAIKRIPDFFRPAAPPPEDDAPRPPLPIGTH
jgi:hypothetical protein